MGQSPLKTCGPPARQQGGGEGGASTSHEVLVDSTLGCDAQEAGSPLVGPSKDSVLIDSFPQLQHRIASETAAGESKPRCCPAGSYLPPSEVGRLVGDDICAICLEPLQGRAQTIAVCGHIFHRLCLNKCGNGLCPKCRLPIDGPVAADAQSSPVDFFVGAHVVIHGLQNHIELNGTRGRIVMCHEVAGRYEVRAIPTGMLFRVKGENLLPGSAETTAAGGDNNQLVGIASGGLDSLEEPLPRSSESTSPLRATEGLSNATSRPPLDFEPGTVVRLTGLRTATRFNGQLAKIVSMDSSRGRYEIKLEEEGSVKTIGADNLELASIVSVALSAPVTERL